MGRGDGMNLKRQATLNVSSSAPSARCGPQGGSCEEDEGADLVPDLLLPVHHIGHAGPADSSVSESSLWEHVGLQAGLSVTKATESRDAPAKK